MKTIITTILVLSALTSHSQLFKRDSNERDDEWWKNHHAETIRKSDSLDQVKRINDNIATVEHFGRLRSEKKNKEDSVKIIREKRQAYYQARYDSIRLVEENQRVLNLAKRDSIDQINAEQDVVKRKHREAELINKYGQSNGNKIINRQVEFGFTKEMCREALGDPSDINSTQTASGADHEQWVYETQVVTGTSSHVKYRYLYFEHGKLTGKQNFD